MTSPLTKPLEFETASIRPSREEERFDQKLLPDGFLLRNGSIRRLVGLVYDPEFVFRHEYRLRNAPDWMKNEGVDVVAKVSPEEAAQWQRETASGYESPAFKHALQHLLVERLKLQAHTIPITVDGYALVLARSVPTKKLVPADEDRPSPDAGPGLVILSPTVEFHHQPLSKLADFVTSLNNSIVEDKTGLIGNYDFSIRDMQAIHPTAQESEDMMRPDERWEVKSLGLKLVHSKVHTTAVIIDHIERPSPN